MIIIKISQRTIVLFFSILILFVIGLYVFAAWQEPAQPPPQANVPAPINVGTVDQFKNAKLGAVTMEAGTFYDKDNYSYYINPSSISVVADIRVDDITALTFHDPTDPNVHLNLSGFSQLGGPIGIAPTDAPAGNTALNVKYDINVDNGVYKQNNTPGLGSSGDPFFCAGTEVLKGIDIRGGIVTDGTCAADEGEAGGGIGGSGTATQLAFFTAGTTLGSTGIATKPYVFWDSTNKRLGFQSLSSSANYFITMVGDSLALKNNDGITRFIIGQDGNTGIGTEIPGAKLDIEVGVGGLDALELNATGTANTLLRLRNDGTETAAIYTLNSDNNFYLRAANALSLGSGGTVGRLYITSTGKIGIGTVAPTSKLFIQMISGIETSWATEDGLVIRDGYYSNGAPFKVLNAGGGTTWFVIDENGRVGIFKSASTTYELDVSGEINADQLCIAGNCKSVWPGDIYVDEAGDTMTGNLTINAPYNITIKGTEANGNVCHQVDGIWYNCPTGGDISGTGAVGQVAFFTGSNIISGNNNLFWDATNNRLGIGINAPAHLLHIVKSDATSPVTLKVQNTAGAGVDVRLILGTSNTPTQDAVGAILFADRTDVGGSSGSTDLLFKTSAGTTMNTWMIIKSDGKIGIGTESPTEKLQVVGNIKLGGTEGDIKDVNAIIGYNDLFLKSNAAENAPVYISGSQLSFYSGGTEKWRIDSTGTLIIGSVPWAKLISFPSDCPAGQYIYGVGGVLKCSTPAGGGGIENAFSQIADDGGLVKFSASGEDTLRLAAGSGLLINYSSINKKVTYSADTNYLQKRVSDSCSVNQAIRSINSDGTVSCVDMPPSAICTWNSITYSTGAKCIIMGGSCGIGNAYRTVYTCYSSGSWSAGSTQCLPYQGIPLCGGGGSG